MSFRFGRLEMTIESGFFSPQFFPSLLTFFCLLSQMFSAFFVAALLSNVKRRKANKRFLRSKRDLISEKREAGSEAS